MPHQSSFPHTWGTGKPRSGLGPCSPLSSACGPAEHPGSLLASPSLQPLTKACRGVMLFPTKAGQVEEKGGEGHRVLVSQCEWWGWHSDQSPGNSCPLLYKYMHKVTCTSSPGSSQGKDPEYIYSSATADLGAKGRSYLMQQPPVGNPHLAWPIPL